MPSNKVPSSSLSTRIEKQNIVPQIYIPFEIRYESILFIHMNIIITRQSNQHWQTYCSQCAKYRSEKTAWHALINENLLLCRGRFRLYHQNVFIYSFSQLLYGILSIPIHFSNLLSVYKPLCKTTESIGMLGRLSRFNSINKAMAVFALCNVFVSVD